MANRFNAVGYSEKHLDDGGHFHFGFAHIRPCDQGINDQEFANGVRVIEYDMPSRVLLANQLTDNYYEVLGNDEWAILMEGDGSDVANDHYKYPRKDDKWAPVREIY